MAPPVKQRLRRYLLHWAYLALHCNETIAVTGSNLDWWTGRLKLPALVDSSWRVNHLPIDAYRLCKKLSIILRSQLKARVLTRAVIFSYLYQT